MNKQATHHTLFPVATPEEELIEQFIGERAMLVRFKQLPALIASLSQEITSTKLTEIITQVKTHPAYKFVGQSAESTQDLLWETEAAIVDRQLAYLTELAANAPSIGTLTLNPNLVYPQDQLAVDIHRMPGGYLLDSGTGDIRSGALYDRGVYVYFGKGLGSDNDLIGQVLSRYLLKRFPELAPQAILDVGCSVGHSTLPYASAFPEATLTGVDLGASMLRYAHARAAYRGVAVNFLQANATKLPLEDGAFDLIVSHILFHEMPVSSTEFFLKECHRLLRPGGIMAHIDLRPYRAVGDYPAMDPWVAFANNLDTFHNNEPYWYVSRTTNFHELSLSVGFAAEQTREDLVSLLPTAAGGSPDPNRLFYTLTAVKQ